MTDAPCDWRLILHREERLLETIGKSGGSVKPSGRIIPSAFLQPFPRLAEENGARIQKAIQIAIVL